MNGRVHCALTMRKTRLCPIKVVTIPRLELQAALMSVQLNQFLQVLLGIPLDKSVFWKDSSAVLKYINNESRRFHTFVANRIAVCDETLLTVTPEVEAILNSRPITKVTADSSDEPLSPNHLLLLRPNDNLPPGIFVRKDGFGKRRWRQAQYSGNLFWRRWVKEYLPLLQTRKKWVLPQENLAVGDMILVMDESTPRGQWPLRRVLNVFPDKWGNVRQVEVKIDHKALRRPIVKLCKLELNEH